MTRLFFYSMFFSLTFLATSCNQEEIVLNTDDSYENHEIEVRCPPYGCGNITPKCEISCKYGGFKIEVYEPTPGVFWYWYMPVNEIYVNHADHINSTYSSSYSYAYFLINNTNPNAPWKDVDGNVIMGPVYVYSLKKQNCNSYFKTNLLYGLTSPCDMNTALLHINQSPNKPSGCGYPNQGSQIICPAPPITTYSGLQHKPMKFKKTTTITNLYGLMCQQNAPGFCISDTISSQVMPEGESNEIYPMVYTHIEYDNVIKLDLWGDPESEIIEIIEEDNGLNEHIIQVFQLSPETKLRVGSYEIEEGESEFGSVVIELEE